MSMKNSKDTIGNRTRDLQACSAVPSIHRPGGYLPACKGLFVFVGLLVEKVVQGQDSLPVLIASLVRIILFIPLSSGAQELYLKNCNEKNHLTKK
jgi:hypothetical protein